MPEFPEISEHSIQTCVGEASLTKGRSYARVGAVFDTKRQGMTLKARVQGQMAEPYRVSVTCDAQKIVDSECSCPVGQGGTCKHVAALLLTWIDTPDVFLEVEDLEASLRRRTKDELIALIRQMVRRAPDLETLLETHVPGSDTGPTRAITSPEVYRRQADTAFRLAGDDWRASYGVASQLHAIQALGDELLKGNDPTSASTVFEGLMTAIVDGYESIHDEEGDIARAADDCAEGLGHCLAQVQDPTRREAILRALFNLYACDVALGGLGMGDEAPGLIVEHATADEKRRVAEWVRSALPPKQKDGGRDYPRRVLGGFLLDLESDILDDATYLQVCRETGRTLDLVERLLQRNRSEEARAEADHADRADLIPCADLFVQHGLGDVAEQLVQARGVAVKSHDVEPLEWLQRRAAARKDKTAVFELARQIFQLRPTLEGYKGLGKFAGKDRWPAVREQLLADLEAAKHRGLRIEIAIHEQDIDRALELLPPGTPSSPGSGMDLQVAEAAEAKRPQAALEIYRVQAEGLIKAQGRGNYQRACELLGKVRALYKKQGQEPAWIAYRDDLHERFRRLSAFQQELVAAKL